MSVLPNCCSLVCIFQYIFVVCAYGPKKKTPTDEEEAFFPHPDNKALWKHVGTLLKHPRNHRKSLQIRCDCEIKPLWNPVGTILNHPRNHRKSLQMQCICETKPFWNHVGTILNHPRNHVKLKEASNKTNVYHGRTVFYYNTK